MAETIFLVRHGEAESNRDLFFGGWLNSPLTPLGRSQALLLSKRLAKEGIEKVFCSDLHRAKETLSLLSIRAPTAYSPALREKSYGEYEGRRWEEDMEKYGRYHTDAHARPPGGENCTDVQKRAVDFFEKKVLQAKEKKILVVSHHGPLVLFTCHFLGMPIKSWRKLRLGNCGLSILVKEDGMWRLKLWNSLSSSGLSTFGSLGIGRTNKK